VVKDTFTRFKFKKIKFEEKKFFNRLHRLVAAKKKPTIGSSLNPMSGPVDSMAPGLYRSDDEEASDESDLDHFEFQESMKVKL
jgi:hypothetical protein